MNINISLARRVRLFRSFILIRLCMGMVFIQTLNRPKRCGIQLGNMNNENRIPNESI